MSEGAAAAMSYNVSAIGATVQQELAMLSLKRCTWSVIFKLQAGYANTGYASNIGYSGHVNFSNLQSSYFSHKHVFAINDVGHHGVDFVDHASIGAMLRASFSFKCSHCNILVLDLGSCDFFQQESAD
jgi:hypothetical protein